MRLKLILMLLTILFCKHCIAQDVVNGRAVTTQHSIIEGTVISEQRTPIIGGIVLLKVGEAVLASDTTSRDGNYRIQVPYNYSILKYDVMFRCEESHLTITGVPNKVGPVTVNACLSTRGIRKR